MSRIGLKPIPLASGVDATVNGSVVLVKGPKGTLTVTLHPDVKAERTPDSAIAVSVKDSANIHQRALWGLSRQLIANAVLGVQKPFEKSLEFVGVGYKVAMNGKSVKMDVGFSHSVDFPLPEGIEGKVEKQVLTLTGIDKHLVGEIAAQIRRVRPPEPYKGKGIKYVDEVIRRKAGKTAKTAA
jgi:large subunit ribosomal protein L6